MWSGHAVEALTVIVQESQAACKCGPRAGERGGACSWPVSDDCNLELHNNIPLLAVEGIRLTAGIAVEHTRHQDLSKLGVTLLGGQAIINIIEQC